MKWSERSPTRVDLAGGTLDMWPLYNFVGGARTINIAIDIMTEAHLELAEDFVWHSVDLGERFHFKTYQDLIRDVRPQVKLLQILVRELWVDPKQGFHLMTRSESPVGGGLGGSSSLIVSLIKVFRRATGLKDMASLDLCLLAHHLEAELLLTPTGTQDYLPAANGGINSIHYTKSGIHVELMDYSQVTELSERFILVYTGRSHHSGLNNFEVLKAAVAKDRKILTALSELKMVADDMHNALKRREFGRMHGLFEKELSLRLMLTPAFSCPEIEKLNQGLETLPGTSLKICGAGGGGCVMIWTEPERREGVQDLCQKLGLHLLNPKFVPVLKKEIDSTLRNS